MFFKCFGAGTSPHGDALAPPTVTPAWSRKSDELNDTVQPLVSAGDAAQTGHARTSAAAQTTREHRGLVPPAYVSASALEQHVRAVSVVRVPGTTAWHHVQNYCVDRLQACGYFVEKRHYATGMNIIATKPGSTLPGEEVWMSAHYDSVPGSIGADDNGSGIAAVLAGAEQLAHLEAPRTLKFALWDEEERGLIGSTAYMSEAKGHQDHIVASLVFEMIGYTGKKPGQNFIGLLGNPQAAGDKALYESLAAAQQLPTRTWSQSWRRSDHVAFVDADYPCLLMFDTCELRNPHYHKMTDTPDTLNYDFAAKVTNVALEVAIQALMRCGQSSAPLKDPSLQLSKALASAHVTTAVAAVRAGAHANMRGAAGFSALHLVTQRGCLWAVHALLAAGANPEIPDSAGWTALDHALSLKHFEVALTLIHFGAAIEHPHVQWRSTALLFAAQCGRDDIIKALLAAGADITARGYGNWNALNFAIEAKRGTTAIQLIQAGLPIEQPHGKLHSTPLMHMAQCGDTDGVRAMLALGANPHAVNRENVNAVHYARAAGHLHVAALLANAQAEGAAPQVSKRVPVAPATPLTTVAWACQNRETLLLEPIEAVPLSHRFTTSDNFGFDAGELVNYLLTARRYVHPYTPAKKLSKRDVARLVTHPSGVGAALSQLDALPPPLQPQTCQALVGLCTALAGDFDEAAGNPRAAEELKRFQAFYAKMGASERAALHDQHGRGYGFEQVWLEVNAGEACLHWTATTLFKLLQNQAKVRPDQLKNSLLTLKATMSRNEGHVR